MSESESSVGEDPRLDMSAADAETEDAVEHDAVDPEAVGPKAVDPESVDPESVDPEAEVVDGFPVLAEVRTIERAAPGALPAVQVAAVAATGFVAGAATVALVKRRAARKIARNNRSGTRRAADLLPIAATRSFLVDVHVIAKPE